jgi:hypothetical protein
MLARMKRMLWVVIVTVMVGSAGVAYAQEAASAEPKIHVGAAATVWLPQSDADDVAETSIGIRPQVTYWVTSLFGIVASFDWVFVSEKEDSGEDSVTYYAISLGGRITLPRPAKIKPFGELLLGRHTLSAETSDIDESGIGFRLGGGALFELGRNIGAIAEISYSSVEIDVGIVDLNLEAFVLEAGVAGRF